MSFKETLDLIHSDFKRYQIEDKMNFFKIILFCPGLWVLTIYRLRRYVKFEFKLLIIKQIFSLLLNLISYILTFITCIQLYPQTKIEKGFYLPHIGTIVFHPETKIGEYCTILQGVTIGNGGRGEERGVPEIGSGVYIGAGAVIIGNIKIGNNVAIGANSVVTKDIPDNAVVGGIPAKIINYHGTQGLIFYEEKEENSA